MIGEQHNVEGKVLNRITRITKNGWEFEAYQRHGEMIIAAMNLHEETGVSSSGEETGPWAEDEEAQCLNLELAYIGSQSQLFSTG